MKTLSFSNFAVGRGNRTLLELDTATDGTRLGPGLHLIVAPNGYGKTTFLQTLAGVLPPLKGEARAGENSLAPSKNVLYISEYLTFPKFIYPPEWIDFVAEGAAREPLTKWIEGFRLTPLMDRYLGRMSQGERRKVTWLGAHASRRPILLLDEPLDGLDLLAIRCARELVSEWKREGRVVCVVAHQISELLDLSDSVLLIKDARFVEWSTAMGGLRAQDASSDEFRRRTLQFYG